MCFSFKNKKVGLSLIVVMVIVMRMNTIMTDNENEEIHNITSGSQ